MIVFSNKGTMDIRSITTFGVSSKDTSNPIGYFGTGLKYAIAVLLRKGEEITIYTGGEAYEFSTRREKLRNDEFEFVYMNDQQLGFTTDLGKNWDLWQAFRELYSNMLDEGGSCKYVEWVFPESSVYSDSTHIVVRGRDFKEVYDKRAEIFLDTKPIEVLNQSLEIHRGPSQYIFFKGVRVAELNTPTLFTYNFLSGLSLTEDRTVTSMFDVQWELSRALPLSENLDIVKAVVHAEKGWFEYQIDFKGTPSDEFVDYVLSKAAKLDRTINPKAYTLCQTSLLDNLPSVGAELTALDEKRLEKAIKFCEDIGFKVQEYPILVSDWLGDGVLGLASNDTIYVSTRIFTAGTKQLVATLIEEYIHLKYQVYDCTRSMQDLLFENIVTLGEHMTGDVL